MEISTRGRTTHVNIDELLSALGGYGTYQKMITAMFCITMFPILYPLVIIYFTTESPPWRCVTNSTICTLHNNTQFNSNNMTRCDMARTDWDYVTRRDFSIVTNFDLVCDKEFLVPLLTSVLFVGAIFGAVILGWIADNYGRKPIHYISLIAVIIFGFASTYLTDIYTLLAFRFIIGFFMTGTVPQLYIMISEIVGDKERTLSNTIMSVAVGLAFPLLALKAYLISISDPGISHWKFLYVLCTIPYLIVLVFYPFVPESVYYLRIKGRTEEAMHIFRRMARWNKKELPSHVTLRPIVHNMYGVTSSLLDICRTGIMAKTSVILSLCAFAHSMTVFSLVLAANTISGHMYRDFAILNFVDVPMTFLTGSMSNKFGRRFTCMLFTFIGSISCLALGLTPNDGKWDGWRVVFGLGATALITGSGMTRTIWSLELYPTRIRGLGIGLGQLSKRIGALCSPWLNKYSPAVHEGGPFIVGGILCLVTFFILSVLPETKGVHREYDQEENEEEVALKARPKRKVTAYSNSAMHLDEKFSQVI